MTMKALLIAATAVLGVTTATAASANVYGAYYSGVVVSGYDKTGVFGKADTSLAGLSYSELFTIDTSKGLELSTLTSDSVFGGISMGMASPVTATITIEGHSQTIAGDFFAVARTGEVGYSPLYQIFDDAQHVSFSTAGVTNDFISGGIATTKAGVIKPTFGDYYIPVDGSKVVNYDSAFGFHTLASNGADVVDAGGILKATSAAPEPSTWALMIGGLAMIGLCFRQAKKHHGFRFKDAFTA